MPRLVSIAAAFACVGCGDLGAYATSSGEVYRGTVVGVEDPPVREPMTFVSLMGDGTPEVRIIAGGGRASDDDVGLFRLTRQAL